MKEIKDQKNHEPKIISKLIRWVVGIIFIIMGLVTLFAGSSLGGLLILTSGAMTLPFVSKSLERKFSLWSQRKVRIVIPLIFFFVGNMINGIQVGSSENEKQDPEFIISEFIKNDTLDKSLKNVRLLKEVGRYFDNTNYSLDSPTDGYLSLVLDSVRKTSVFTFNPKIDFEKVELNGYLLQDPIKGSLTDYYIVFEIDSDYKVINKKSFLTYTKGGLKIYQNSSVPNLVDLLDNKLFEQRKIEYQLEIAAEEQLAKDKKQYQQRKEKFEESCLNTWDGSHTALVSYVEDNMNDPDSFEHVETRYILQKDYAYVIMKFRGKNAFGGLVLNSISAKVDLDDCSIISIEE